MADPDPIGADVRRAKAKRSLPPDAACVYCGERNPQALTKVKARLLDGHHPAGEANDPDLEVVLCLTHHKLNTIAQMDTGVELWHKVQSSLPERLVSVLRGLAAFFALLALRLLAWADGLTALIVALDRNYPPWRELPESEM